MGWCIGDCVPTHVKVEVGLDVYVCANLVFVSEQTIQANAFQRVCTYVRPEREIEMSDGERERERERERKIANSYQSQEREIIYSSTF